MSRPIPFKKPHAPATGEDHTLALMRKVFESLSPELQEVFAREVAEKTKIETARGGDVLKAIVKVLPLFPKEKAWSVTDLKERVQDAGVSAGPKEFYNAVGYLARTGRVRRIGYGRYMIDGTIVATSDDFGGATASQEDAYRVEERDNR